MAQTSALPHLYGLIRLLTPALSSFGEERENYFVGRFPGVAAARQHRANFRSAFSAFEFASEKSVFIRVHPWLNLLQHLSAHENDDLNHDIL